MTAKWSGQDDSERGEFSEYGRGRWNVPVLILTLAMLGLLAIAGVVPGAVAGIIAYAL